MRRFLFVLGSSVSVASFSTTALAQYEPPTGYQIIPLVDSSGQPFSPGGLAVNSTGEMAVTNGDTVTLYNTWQNGRSVLASATDSAWLFDTDPVFLNPTTILFGENGNTDALWSVNFATPTPTIKPVTSNNSLDFVEGVAILDANHALVSGQTNGGGGGLYLDSVKLSTGGISSVVSNVGATFPGNPGVTSAGNLVLLEDNFTGTSIAHVYTSSGAPIDDDNLDNGNGTGASGIAFDSAGNAFITTQTTLTMITGIDGASPIVSEFGTGDNPDSFFTSISYTGGAFNAGEAGDTGALIVNDAGGTGAFAIIVPEPASIGLLGFASLLLARRRGARA